MISQHVLYGRKSILTLFINQGEKLPSQELIRSIIDTANLPDVMSERCNDDVLGIYHNEIRGSFVSHLQNREDIVRYLAPLTLIDLMDLPQAGQAVSDRYLEALYKVKSLRAYEGFVKTPTIRDYDHIFIDMTLPNPKVKWISLEQSVERGKTLNRNIEFKYYWDPMVKMLFEYSFCSIPHRMNLYNVPVARDPRNPHMPITGQDRLNSGELVEIPRERLDFISAKWDQIAEQLTDHIIPGLMVNHGFDPIEIRIYRAHFSTIKAYGKK